MEGQTPVHQDSFTAGSSSAECLPPSFSPSPFSPSLFSNNTKLQIHPCLSLAQLDSLAAKEPTSLSRMTWSLDHRALRDICLLESSVTLPQILLAHTPHTFLTSYRHAPTWTYPDAPRETSHCLTPHDLLSFIKHKIHLGTLTLEFHGPVSPLLHS